MTNQIRNMRAAYISNDVEGLDEQFAKQGQLKFEKLLIGQDFKPNLTPYDLVLVPNGSDHVALGSIKDDIRAFLKAGKSLFCFDGWFNDWLPGNTWVYDISKPTKDVRYSICNPPQGLMAGVRLDDFQFMEGISGWWACGYIEPAPGAQVVMTDTWHRPVVVWDQKTTPGTLFMTASGPLGFQTIAGKRNGLTQLFENALNLIGKPMVPSPKPDSRGMK